MTKICCVQGCKNECYPGGGISMFKFPTNEDIRKRWLEVVPLKNHKLNYNNTFVCDRHFKTEDKVVNLWKTRLKSDAVPCIFPISVKKQRIFQFKLTQSISEEESEAEDESVSEDEPEDDESSNSTPQKNRTNITVKPVSQINKMGADTAIKPEFNEGSAGASTSYIQITPMDCYPMKMIGPRPTSVKQTAFDLSTQTMPLRTSRERILRKELKALGIRLRRRMIAFNKLRSLLRMIKHKCKNYDDVQKLLALKLHQVPEVITNQEKEVDK